MRIPHGGRQTEDKAVGAEATCTIKPVFQNVLVSEAKRELPLLLSARVNGGADHASR